MKVFFRMSLVLSGLIFIGCSGQDKPAYNHETAVLLVNAAVFDVVTGRMDRPVDLLVDGEQIIALKPGGSTLKAGKKIDCEGKYVIPGLCDSHMHAAFLTTMEEGTLEKNLQAFVQHGVLYMRDVGGPVDRMQKKKNRITSGALTGPDLYYTGPMLESNPLHWEKFNKMMPGFTVALETEEDVDRLLPELAAKGATMIKTFNNTKPELYPHIVETAGRHGLKIVHDPGIPIFNQVPVEMALKHGVTSIEHSFSVWNYLIKDEFRPEMDRLNTPDTERTRKMAFLMKMADLGVDSISPEKMDKLAALMIEKGAVLCPTLRVFPDDLKEIEAQEAGGESNAELAARKRRVQRLAIMGDYFVKELTNRGVRMLVGQDNIEPAGTVEEMILLAKAGVTPVEVLRGATIYAMEWLGLAHKYGSIEAGKMADLVVLEANPLADIANTQKVAMVFQRGKIVIEK